MKKVSPSIIWFRQDLRLNDHAALTAAAAEGPVLAVYVLDDRIAGDWKIGAAQRWWLHHSLRALDHALAHHEVPLVLRRGDAVSIIPDLAHEVGATAVHCLEQYEPWWQEVDAAIAKKVMLKKYDGYLLADPRKIRTGGGKPYRVFAPFWAALREILPPAELLPAPKDLKGATMKLKSDHLEDWALLPKAPNWATGFAEWVAGEQAALEKLKALKSKIADYQQDRDNPSADGTSRLSPHLHHGEISPARIWRTISNDKGSEPFLRELAWRDFTSNLILQGPDYADADGRPEMEKLPWRSGKSADKDFEAWTKGMTGYPIVDAGMRQLWNTGWMHNRARMLTASFLVKHLLIDWRRGEKWFWDCLVDADYGNNSVNWQWIAGTGVDSAPFFRVMAPLTQSEKFDAADYIRKWVPELAELSDTDIHDPHAADVAPQSYCLQIASHKDGRERALAAFEKVKNKQ